MTPKGVWIYGIFIGVLIVVIRLWGGLPDGVMYAILLANALAPHLDNMLRPRYMARKKMSLRIVLMDDMNAKKPMRHHA
ncbi:MAG: RnfABCDGE type electron transport complex subunit D [Saprospiraceae bacterium]